MLAVQMAAVHLGTMKTAEAAMTAVMREQQQWAGGCLAKLSRTFAMQVDTLKNLRLNGSQHIHIYHNEPTRPQGGLRKTRANPMHQGSEIKEIKLARLRSAPRCTAKSKRSQLACRAPAVRGLVRSAACMVERLALRKASATAL